MKRILGIACALIIVLVLWCSPAWALSISGGTPEQQSLTREAMEACWVPLANVEAGVGGLTVEIVDHYPPWFDLPEGAFVDVLHGVAGLAWYGHIVICASYEPGYDSFFVEIAIHELSHQVWFGMPLSANMAWEAMVTLGRVWDEQMWTQDPAENFAENLKMTWDSKYMQIDYPRTDLLVLTPEQTKAWYAANVLPPPTTTTTLPPTTTTTVPPTTTTTTVPPFIDIKGLDQEGYDAIVWCALHGYVLGYPDGTFMPYGWLLVRHVALIAGRAGLVAPAGWEASYVPALRGDVRLTFPSLTFDSERWEETLTRSQMCRLLFRDR